MSVWSASRILSIRNVTKGAAEGLTRNGVSGAPTIRSSYVGEYAQPKVQLFRLLLDCPPPDQNSNLRAQALREMEA